MEMVSEILSWLMAVGTVVVIGYAVYVMFARRRIRRLIEAHSCKLCGQSFSDALAEVTGRPTAAERNCLDVFQRRYACWRVLYHECGAVNICTAAGEPYVALIDHT